MEEYKEMEMDSHLFVFNDLAGKCGVMIDPRGTNFGGELILRHTCTVMS